MINPDLLVIKRPSDLTTVTTLEPGNFLFYDGDGNLKTIDTNLFYQILNNFARPIAPADTGPFNANRWYKPTVSSADPGANYPNAGNLKAKSGFDTLFFYDGTNWTKTEVQFPQASQNIRIWSAQAYGVNEQVIKDNTQYITPDGAAAGDIPGVSDKWTPLSVSKKLLDSTLNGFETINNIIMGHLDYNQDPYMRTDEGFYIFKLGKTADYYIGDIKFNAIPGTMHFSYGLIDQHNKFIETETFTRSVVNLQNTISINKRFKSNEFLAIKSPGIIPAFKAPKENSILHYAFPYTAEIVEAPAFSFAVEIDAFDVEETGEPYAKESEIQTLRSQINNLPDKSVLTAPDGGKWKLKVSNTGVLSTQKIGEYTKILHFGNSMLKHDIVSYWWGNWGMAATTRQNDYAHRLLSKIKVANPTATSVEYNIAVWEVAYQTYDKTNFDAYYTSNPDLIIVRLGENATWSPQYKASYASLIDYFISKAPNARIVIVGTFWYHAQKDADMKAVADERGLTFISLQGLDTPANRSSLGTVVQGDDGQSHTINDQGVADHPGDVGMEAIAERLFVGVNS